MGTSNVSTDMCSIYDPNVRMHVRPSSVMKHLLRLDTHDSLSTLSSQNSHHTLMSQDWQHNISQQGSQCKVSQPDTLSTPLQPPPQNTAPQHSTMQNLPAQPTDTLRLLDILKILDARHVTGHAALDLLVWYAREAGALESKDLTDDDQLTLLDVLLRCLDRNLRVGVNTRIISSAYKVESASDDHFTPFGVALGKSISVEDLGRLFENISDVDERGQDWWFISRKLDGVRCIIVVEVEMSSMSVFCESQKLQVTSVRAVSRSGRPIRTLSILLEQVRKGVSQSVHVRQVLQDAAEKGQQLGPANKPGTATIYMDGEVCVLREATEKDKVTGQGCVGQSESEAPPPLVEDFAGIVGPLKRKNYTVPNPAYFPFDMLTYDEFHYWSSDTARFSHAPFWVRKQRVEEFVKESEEKAGRGPSAVIRSLEQVRVCTVDQVRVWMQRAIENDWEGLILRRGNAYEGKRRYVELLEYDMI